ncbi:MAG: putative RNA-binding protein (virulence factor B family) [Phenylobacterium sp.]|jgi:predicted RNA-binding protein (virulence factor B family)
MAIIGAINTLEIVKQVDFGVYLDGSDLGEILLPRKYVPDDSNVGDTVEAFVYLDSEDRLIATTRKPYAKVGEFASLEVIAVNDVGAFLDWGLEKDLLVPFGEQKQRLEVGRRYLVFVYIGRVDKRITASAKIDKFLDHTEPKYNAGDEVNLIMGGQTDLGFKAIVNNAHWGVIYKDEVFQFLKPGSKHKGFIKQIREDGKIDLSLTRPAGVQRDELSQKVLDELQKLGGYLAISDKSPPEVIYRKFSVSKRIYKQTIGGLFKQGLITIEPKGIRLKND